ncbi:MAG: phosphate acyltransferase PlsX [Oligoflexia bacterium]|nr:phosphate acyltransferase PlsX [Oligoflexia bacterium]
MSSSGIQSTVYLDAMGGDLAPKVNVRGALIASAEKKDIKIVLVGEEKKLTSLLDTESKKVKGHDLSRISIVHTNEWIKMDDHPSSAVRQKKDASINIAMKLAAQEKNSAFLSAGNSGAALASAILYMKRIEGVERPAIAAPLPTTRGFLLLLDAGANTQCKPIHLAQWAILGSHYYKSIFQGTQGSVGILSNGSEDSKGTDLTRQTNEVLKHLQAKSVFEEDIYKGYVEGGRLFHGNCDVVVCDGFTGNLVLKSLEGLALAVTDLLKKEIKQDWLAMVGAVFALRAMKKLKQRTDYAEVGAAPLIGVNGHAFISHGRSNAKAIKNGIIRASESARTNLPETLQKVIQDSQKLIDQYLDKVESEKKA